MTVTPESYSEASKESPIVVIYIGGYGRSGSTLLGRLLSQELNAFDAGELASIFTTVDHSEQLCGCGQTIEKCEFWQRVTGILRDRLGEGFEETLARDRKSAENVSFLYRLPFVSRHRVRLNRYQNYVAALLDAISEVSGAKLIIDSSKSTYRAAWRPVLLSGISGVEICFLHLVRRCGGVYRSVQRGSNRAMENNKEASQKLPLLRVLFGWTIANLVASRCSAALQSDNRLRYEELESDAQPIIEQFRDVSAESKLECHSFGGNRMRHKPLKGFQRDDAWKSEVPWVKRLICGIADSIVYAKSNPKVGR